MAFVIASVAGAITLLPGGIGSFEAGAIGTLLLLGVPLEGAVAGTLMFRGFSLWLPLVPGLLMARKDMALFQS